MVEKNKDAFIQQLVDEHLEAEIAGGNPIRARRAKIAQAANKTFRLGEWCWEEDLAGLGGPSKRNLGTVIIPLVRLARRQRV